MLLTPKNFQMLTSSWQKYMQKMSNFAFLMATKEFLKSVASLCSKTPWVRSWALCPEKAWLPVSQRTDFFKWLLYHSFAFLVFLLYTTTCSQKHYTFNPENRNFWFKAGRDHNIFCMCKQMNQCDCILNIKQFICNYYIVTELLHSNKTLKLNEYYNSINSFYDKSEKCSYPWYSNTDPW